MKKMILTASVILPLACLAGCSKGIEKEYKLDIQEFVQVKNSSGEIKPAAHCKRSLSLLNYYIQLPDTTTYGADEIKIYSVLIAKSTELVEGFTLVSDGSAVSDHGYKFVNWEEASVNA